MPAEKSAAAVPELPHPGDIVQVTDVAHSAFPALLLVHQVRAKHIEAHDVPPVAHTMRDGPARLKPGQYSIVGAAALLPPDLNKARAASLQTAREVARDSAK